MAAPDLIRCRPAETTGAAGAVALLVAHAVGVSDPDTIVALGVVIALLPAGVTWLVNVWRSGRG